MSSQRTRVLLAVAATIAAMTAPLHGTNDGALDPGFANGSGELHVTLAEDESVYANAIRVGPTQDLTLAGTHSAPGAADSDMWLCSIVMDGTSASCSAQAVATGDPRENVASAVAYQLDGRRTLAGYATGANGHDLAFLGIVADDSNALDPSFSGDGRKTIGFAGSAAVSAIDARRDGDLLFTGTYDHGASQAGTGNDCVVGRMNADGTLDTSFSGNGLLTVGWDLGPDADDTCTGQTLFHDGSVAVAARVQRADGSFSFGVARTTSDGNLDTTFSGNGQALVTFADLTGSVSDQPNAIAHDRLGRILVAGVAATSGGEKYAAVARLLPNGKLDPSFGIGGKVAFEIAGNGPDVESVSSLVVLPPPSNDIAIGGGYSDPTGHVQGFVAALDEDGILDASFSGDGRRTLDLDPHMRNAVTGLAAQGGKLVAASAFTDHVFLPHTTFEFAVYRLYRDQIFGDDFEGGNLFLWSNRADP